MISATQDISIKGGLTDQSLSANNRAIGEVIDHVLFKDIKLFIEGSPIESFNINGSTAMYVKDLKAFGYTVQCLGDERKINAHFQDTGVNGEENLEGIAKKVFEDGSIYEVSCRIIFFMGMAHTYYLMGTK